MAELSTLGSVIKTAYEGQPNTNAFTDPEKAKLAGLSELAASGQWGDVQGKPGVIAAGATESEARDAIGAISAGEKGAANGVATLDAAGTVPLTQINLEGLAYKGLWDAETNTPTINDGEGEDADFYFASSTATVDLGSGPQAFLEGDIVIYYDGVWSRLGSSQIVQSVNGQIGNVQITVASLGALPDSYQPAWDDIQNKPAMPAALRGNIGPAIPALRQVLTSNQTIPISTNTQISAWGSGYDQFSMASGGRFTIPAWAAYARVTCSVAADNIQTGRFLALELRRGATVLGGGICPGVASEKFPSAYADTGIFSVSGGDEIISVIWHNADSPKLLNAGTRSMINIELFEAP